MRWSHLIFFVGALSSAAAHASTPVQFLETKHSINDGLKGQEPRASLSAALSDLFAAPQIRVVKAQIMYREADVPDHVLVHLFLNGYHRVDFARVELDAHYNLGAVTRAYHLTPADQAQQPGIAPADAKCPDDTVQFIAFAPNDDPTEQGVTADVIKAAQNAKLKTVSLLQADATSTNYLNYMTCPNLRGNFYDGDANTSELATVDGVIESTTFSSDLKGAFRYQVTNIWLACEAYNDPMLTSVQSDDQSRKYAAGVNDLEVGPSDKAGACAMEAAIAGQPMTAAFQACYKQNDTTDDQWGFGGQGSDNFWD